MTSVMPEGEGIRKAVKWISDNRQDRPDQSLSTLINDAVLRFNLSPKDAEFLINFYRESRKSATQA